MMFFTAVFVSVASAFPYCEDMENKNFCRMFGGCVWENGSCVTEAEKATCLTMRPELCPDGYFLDPHKEDGLCKTSEVCTERDVDTCCSEINELPVKELEPPLKESVPYPVPFPAPHPTEPLVKESEQYPAPFPAPIPTMVYSPAQAPTPSSPLSVPPPMGKTLKIGRVPKRLNTALLERHWDAAVTAPQARFKRVRVALKTKQTCGKRLLHASRF